jgi:hypothetical protein
MAQFTTGMAGPAAVAKLEEMWDRADAIDNRIYPGTYAELPATRPDTTARQEGDHCVLDTGVEYIFLAGVWVDYRAHAASASADATQAALDRIATGEDRVQTSADRVQAALDRIATGEDREQTGLDRAQTALDVIATAASASAAGASATNAEASRDAIDNRIYPGTYAADPATRPDASAIQAGDEYFNSVSNLKLRYNGATWVASDINTANLAASSGSTLIGWLSGLTGGIARTLWNRLLGIPLDLEDMEPPARDPSGPRGLRGCRRRRDGRPHGAHERRCERQAHRRAARQDLQVQQHADDHRQAD